MASFLTHSTVLLFPSDRDMCVQMHVCIPKYMWRREQERQLISLTSVALRPSGGPFTHIHFSV